MRNKHLLVRFCCVATILFGLSTALRAQTDEELYLSYMDGQLTLWKTYLDTTNWTHLTHAERLRLINYEYGYVPFLADRNDPSAQQYLNRYMRHLAEEQSQLTPSLYASYMCAAHAYAYLLDKKKLFSSGLQSFRLAKQAVDLDGENPIALLLKGNVYFYAPRAFGGNKEEAMLLFEKAERIMQQQGIWHYLWNYPALQLCIAQCYDKLGNTEKAYQKCQVILREHPDFDYVKRVYLPELNKRRK